MLFRVSVYCITFFPFVFTFSFDINSKYTSHREAKHQFTAFALDPSTIDL